MKIELDLIEFETPDRVYINIVECEDVYVTLDKLNYDQLDYLCETFRADLFAEAEIDDKKTKDKFIEAGGRSKKK